jgi:hypothetical protein
MRVIVEQLVEWRLAGETEVLGENLPQRHLVHHKSHLPDPGSNPGSRGGKPATNRLSYGAAFVFPSVPKHSRVDSLGRWSARRKTATYTKNNINTE